MENLRKMMKKNDIDKLVQLREFVIHEYNRLDGRLNPTGAVMKQLDAAVTYEEIVKKLDSILSEHVSFKEDKKKK
tara:strand:+ start:786 stop:1010 length:225 start_codon:yes stop_codon:yes gene_type:complete